jgi:hypothetical protein
MRPRRKRRGRFLSSEQRFYRAKDQLLRPFICPAGTKRATSRRSALSRAPVLATGGEEAVTPCAATGRSISPLFTDPPNGYCPARYRQEEQIASSGVHVPVPSSRFPGAAGLAPAMYPAGDLAPRPAQRTAPGQGGSAASASGRFSVRRGLLGTKTARLTGGRPLIGPPREGLRPLLLAGGETGERGCSEWRGTARRFWPWHRREGTKRGRASRRPPRRWRRSNRSSCRRLTGSGGST